ncbi:hypothetical protein [Pontibacter indicus]|uniref:YD repeat-containing protein n=1 Tax=Pontibacter indicus TaxID=1317125 RepID=A0A1R3XDJ0_9BACT|nr:hypothetical protein [Pontibacter indicus]SIT89375.1 hypothetical protein SAMN05444128_2007 [Pontibacter indicus]
MRKTVLLLLLASTVSLNSCSPALYPEVDERLTTLPTQPHAYDIEVFFAGEWPKEEYIKLAALETRTGGNVPYAYMIKNLQDKARVYGADAIIVQDKNFIPDVQTGVITDAVYTTNLGTLTGIAIKYKKYMDTNLMPKTQQVEMYDPITGTYQPLINLAYWPDGNLQEKEELRENAAFIYSNYIGSYTMRHLQERGPCWSHRMQEGYVVERELHRDGLLQKRMEFDYDVARRLKQIRIRNTRGASEEINFVYDEAGRLSQRIIFKSGNPYIEEVYRYNEAGEAAEVQVYNTNLPEKLPLLRSTYTYYTLEEI